MEAETTSSKYRRMLLTGLLQWLSQVALSYNSEQPDQKWHHFQYAGPSHINNKPRKCLMDMPTAQSDNSLIEVLSYQMTLVCVKFIKANQYN